MSGCTKLTQYKKRHDKVALRVHWQLSKRYGFESGENWYEHQPLPVIENDQVKLMRDHRPDITLALKDKQQWIMIDVAVPDDPEAEKIERYQELAFAPGRSYSGATGHSGSRNSLIRFCEMAGILGYP